MGAVVRVMHTGLVLWRLRVEREVNLKCLEGHAPPGFYTRPGLASPLTHRRFIVRVGPLESEPITRFTVPDRSQLEKRVFLTPRAARLLPSAQAGVDEDRPAAATGTSDEVLQLGAGPDRYQEKRRHTRSSYEVKK